MQDPNIWTDTAKVTKIGQDIKEKQPFYELYFKKIYTTIKICEDCGQDLQNDMSDEYHKFVDLGL